MSLTSIFLCFLVVGVGYDQAFAKDKRHSSHSRRGSEPIRGGVSYFDLQRLPLGKNVTLPRPATTVIPPLARVQLTGTDIPQSLSFRAVSKSGPVDGHIIVAIYDQNSEKVVHTEVNYDTIYIYNIKDLRPIMVITEGGDHRLTLQVESDKPLELTR